MTLDILQLEKKLICAGIEKSEAKKELSLLLEEFSDLKKIKDTVEERIKTRTPIQYLIGKAYFMDFEVKVNKHVLIPRPETEILVEETIKRISLLNKKNFKCGLEIGTGTGIIPIAICKVLQDMNFIVTDIEQNILDLAFENATKYKIDSRIQFKLCDLFSDSISKLFERFKINFIISNPPYIQDEKLKKLKPEVYLHEPRVALTGSVENDGGIVYYERILRLAKKYLESPSLVALEIDPPLVEDLNAFLKQMNFQKFEIIKDYAKLDRCLFVYL